MNTFRELFDERDREHIIEALQERSPAVGHNSAYLIDHVRSNI